MLVVASILLFLHLPSARGDEAECVVRRPFQSPSVSMLYEQAASVAGCLSRQLSSKQQAVYVVSLRRAGPPSSPPPTAGFLPRVQVHVQPLGAPAAVVVLHADQPVLWHVESAAQRLSVIATSQSQAVAPQPVSYRRKLGTLRQVLRWVTKAYDGALSSVARVEPRANVLHIGPVPGTGADVPASCKVTADSPLPHIQASFVQAQPLAGCQVDAPRERLVLVVEVGSTRGASAVAVNLRPLGGLQSDVERDLALVLKSPPNITWNLHSWGVRGHLLVLAESDVLGTDLPSHHVLQVRTVVLPGSGSQLLSEARGLLGMTIHSFIAAPLANRINIVVSPFHKSPKMPPILPGAPSLKEKFRLQMGRLLPAVLGGVPSSSDELGVVVSCRPAGRIAVSLPRPRLSTLRATLADPSCRLQPNDTHLSLEFGLRECRTAAPPPRHDTQVFHNRVEVWLGGEELQDDEDMVAENGSGNSPLGSGEGPRPLVTVHFHCMYNLTTDQPLTLPKPHQDKEDFQLSLFTDSNLTQPISSFPSHIQVHGHIFVQASSSSQDSGQCNSVEDCWLSTLPHTDKFSLLINGCPSDLSVSPPGSSNCQAQFGFQLAERFLRQEVYLQCRLMSCARPGPCQQPCGANLTSLRPFLPQPRGARLVVLGPLRVVPKSQPNKPAAAVFSQQVVLVGLPTETVVGIAFAAFLLGASFMGLLWFIHLRTDPLRQNQSPQSNFPQLSGYELSGTPYSQSPPTVPSAIST